MNDCLRRIAGLNSPASPPLREKNPDTSYNSHALQAGKGEKNSARKWTSGRLRPPQITATTIHATDALRSKHKTSHGGSAADTHNLIPLFLEQPGVFFRPLSPPAHSATFGRIKAQLLRFFSSCTMHASIFLKVAAAYQRHALRSTHENTCRLEKIYLDSRLQILSCEWSYNKKG